MFQIWICFPLNCYNLESASASALALALASAQMPLDPLPWNQLLIILSTLWKLAIREELTKGVEQNRQSACNNMMMMVVEESG